jgi:hypothetical protein
MNYGYNTSNPQKKPHVPPIGIINGLGLKGIRERKKNF